MFRDDEKEEKGVLIFLGLLIGAIVASIFGFAIYQSGVAKSLVGDSHVVGKDSNVELAVPAGAAATALINELQTKDSVLYDHAADLAHQEKFGTHAHDEDFVASVGSDLTEEDLKALHKEKHHAGTVYKHDDDRGHMAIYGEHTHNKAFVSKDGSKSEEELKAEHMEEFHPRARYDHAADTEHLAQYGDHMHPDGDFVAPEASGITQEQLKEAHIGKFHAAPPNAKPVELSDETGASFKLVDGVAKFYFATGKTKVIDGAVNQLSGIVAELKEGKKKAVLSGFVDPRGSAELNAELSKNRAKAVRDLLIAQGVAEDAIELRKPSDIVPEGTDYAELRRVELTLEER